MKVGKIDVASELLTEICDRWQISSLDAFGSVLREDFTDESDIDLIVTFAPSESVKGLDVLEIQEELSSLFARHVDLVERTQLKWVVRERILKEARPVFSRG